MLLTRRGFVKSAAAAIVVAATMPDLASAEIQRFWQLDQTQMRGLESVQGCQHCPPLGGPDTVWDLIITPNSGSALVQAVYSKQGSAHTHITMDLPVLLLSNAYPMMDPHRPFIEALDQVLPGAQLGSVRYAYPSAGGIKYRPLRAYDRLHDRGL